MTPEILPTPETFKGKRVLNTLDEWRVVDRWWTDDPIDRTYKEVELEGGERTVIFKQGATDWVEYSPKED